MIPTENNGTAPYKEQKFYWLINFMFTTSGKAAVLRIRIRTDPRSFWSAGSGTGSALGIRIQIQEAKITHKSEENSNF
jgi:hypothetical protein